MLTASKLTVFDVALVVESNEYGLPLGTTRMDLCFAIASREIARANVGRGSFHEKGERTPPGEALASVTERLSRDPFSVTLGACWGDDEGMAFVIDRGSLRAEDRLRAPAVQVPSLVDGGAVRRRSRQGLSLRSVPGRDASVLRARGVCVRPSDEESIAGRADRVRPAIRSVRRRQLLLVSRVSQARASDRVTDGSSVTRHTVTGVSKRPK